MDNHSFNMLIRPLNIEYRKIFGEIPRITNYSCSREEYVAALKAAIRDKKSLTGMLIPRESRYPDMKQPED